MELGKRKKTLVVTFLLAFLTVLGFALTVIRQAGQAPDPGPPVTDTVVNQRNPKADSIYRSYVYGADKLVQDKKYDEALALLDKALALKPNEATLKNKILQVKAMSAQQKKDETDFAQLIASADKYYAAKAYLDAKSTYQLALNIKPEDKYAQGKLNEVMGILRSQKAQNILYDVAVANADKYYAAGDLDKAKAEYEKASQILPGDSYAKDKMNEIIKIQVDKQVREELYAQAITKADQLYNLKKYSGALTEYKNALKQKPAEKYPQDRIKEITDILNQLKALDEAYQKALAVADQLFVAKRYPEAKTGYQDALKIKPDEAYPKNKIREIDQILAGLLRSKEDYDRYIALADSFYIDKNFILARQNYQLALGVKPNEAYPKEMLSKTDQGLSTQEMSQKMLDESYSATIAAADKLFWDKSYEDARKQYNAALQLKPAEAYPKTRIAEIDKALEVIAQLRSVDEKYAAFIADADKLLSEKSYPEAKAKYQSASAVKPLETYPKEKITEIDGILAGIAKQQETDKQYASLITKADQSFAAKAYDAALTVYNQALGLKPDEQYPKDKIAEIGKIQDDLSKQKQALEDQYASLIAEGDRLLAEKTYPDAKAKYTEALAVKPAEQYPKTKIAEIDAALDALAKQKALDDQYAGLLAEGDKLLGEKSYPDARAKYQSASGLKPSEEYPKKKISEIDAILGDIAKQKAIDDQYAGEIAKADKSFAAQAYDDALASYNTALTLKPAEQYPKDKIAEIGKIRDDIAKQKQALEDQYASLIASGDKLLAAKTYAEAKSKFTEALAIKPAEQYPKTKIAEIDVALDAIAKQKALDDQYTGLLAEGDKLLGEKAYPDARAKYQSASGMKPSEEYPKKKISEIDAILGDIAKQKAIDDQYAGEIAKADKAFAAQAYDDALASYNTALTLKPAEQYPKDKIAEIGKIRDDIAKQKQALEDQYASLIASGDKLLAAKTYAEAKSKYTEALGIKPAEQYPKTKLAEIDAALDALAKQKALDDQYAGILAEGDRLLGEKSYTDARGKYQSASGMKPSEEYPKKKISEIDAILGDIAKQKAIDDQYAGEIAKADKSFAAKAYDEALSSYNTALSLKPAEQYPKDKIAEIGKIRDDIAKQKALDDQYAGIIATADKQLAAKTYEEARKSYTEALGLKPAEKYPQEKITQIDGILGEIAKQKALDDQYASLIASGDKLLAAKTYSEAKAKYTEALAIKPAEQYPKTKIAEIDAALDALAKQKALDDQYAGLLAEGDRLLGEKSYTDARGKYQSASGMKPSEEYPKKKISEIDAILGDIAKQKAIDDQYAGEIAKADKSFAAKAYDEALSSYNTALSLKPAEQYPKDKIAGIGKIKDDIAKQKALDDQYAGIIATADKQLAAKTYDVARKSYTDALGLKPAEKYPQEKITQIDGILAGIAKQKALDDQYASLISSGDQLLAAKTYSEAKAKYTDALGIKPAEQYPKTKIAEIDAVFAKLKDIDDQYNASIGKADQLLAAKSYTEARTEYQNSLKIKSSEQYPKDKIAEIDAALAELNRQKNINDQYKAQVTKADQLFSTKQYGQARTEYLAAQGIKADEQYPKDRIAEIDNLLAELKAKDDAYKAAIAKADQLFAEKSYEPSRTEYQNASAIKPLEQYPKDKIGDINRILTEIQGKKVTYDNLLKSAGDFLAVKEYNKSKEQYQQASGIFPEESFPKERIAWITRTVDSIYRVNKADYDREVANGDKYYTAFEFDKAIDAYTAALGYLPMENYPKEQIAKIRRTISENAIVDVLKTPVTIAAGDEKKFSFEPVNIASRKDNFVYLKIRNLSDKPFNILMRYGRDAQSNGGVVIRNVSTDGKVNERLISVRDQDLWYRADNNWISLFPQGGDIEVSFIQVSKVR